MNRTWRIAGLIAIFTLVVQSSLADQFTLRIPVNPSPSGADGPKKAPTRMVIVEQVTKPMPSVESKLPFVGESPFGPDGDLPRPFVGERLELKVTVLPYFGARLNSQPPTDPTSTQIPAEKEKR